jgi:hypothetical protein
MSKRFGKKRVCDYDAPGGPCTTRYTCGACLAAAVPTGQPQGNKETA